MKIFPRASSSKKKTKFEPLRVNPVEDIATYAETYLPDEQNDGEFDEFMHETVNDIAYDIVNDLRENGIDTDGVDMCDAFYDTYPTKEVEEFMAEGKTLEEAIVAYLESKIEYIKEWA